MPLVSLAMELRGLVVHPRRGAPEGVLDTYQAERHTIGAQVLEWTRGHVALMRPDPEVGTLRSVVTDLMGTRDGMTVIVNKISGVMQHVTCRRLTSQLVTLFSGAWFQHHSRGRSVFAFGIPIDRFVLLDRSENAVCRYDGCSVEE